MKTENKNKLVRTGGIFSGLFLILHIGFYWLFRWEQTLQVMNPTDRAILLTLNLVGILFLVYATTVSFLQASQLPRTPVGRSVLVLFASFYLLRVVAEIVFFGFVVPKSILAIVLCLIPAACYALAAVPQPENN